MFGVTIIAMAFASTFALILGFNAHAIGHKFGLLDWPDLDGGRKRHARVTPLVGGTAVVLAMAAASLLTQAYLQPTDLRVANHLGWLTFGVMILYVVGLTDDRADLSPRMRLAISVPALLFVLWFAPGFRLDALEFDSLPGLWSLNGFGWLFALVCLIGLINAVNMADGKNGLVIGLSLIWSAVLAIEAPIAFLPVILAGTTALLVMFWFNMRSQLFLGDGGSYGLSAAFGLIAIYAHNANPGSFSAEQVALMFLIPVADTVRLMASRILRGTSPFAPDRNHLHHYLAQRFDWPRGLAIYIALVAIPNCVALILPGSALLGLVVTMLCYVAVLVMCGRRAFAMAGETSR